jgi:hypothetical protein
MSLFYYTFDGTTLGDQALSNMFHSLKLGKREGWEDAMEERLRYFKGIQFDDLEERLRDQYPASYTDLRPYLYLNVYRKIIEAMAMVYYESPERKVNTDNEADQELFDRIYEGALVDVFLKMAESYAAMFQTAFVQWRYSQVKRQVVLDVVEPQRFEIVQSKMEPLELNACQALVMELQARTDTNTEGSDQTLRYHYWSAGPDPLGGKYLSFIYNSKGMIEPWPDEFNNPNFINTYVDPETDYSIYPYVKLDWDKPTIEFFDIGGDDLMSAVENFDMRLVDLMYGAKMQSFSVPVMISGPSDEAPPKTVSFGPGLLMKVISMGDQVGDFRFETPDPKLQEILDMLLDLIELVGRLKGADPAGVRLKGEAPESGYAKQLDRGDAIKSRKARLQYWRAYEQEIARKMMIVHNAWAQDGEDTFSDEAIAEGVTVDFADVQAELSPQEAIEIDRMREEDGLISRVDRMIKYNPDLSREDAEQQIKDNLELNKKVKGRVDVEDMFKPKPNPFDDLNKDEDEDEEGDDGV